MSENKKFLGVGWKFPINVSSTSTIQASEYEENIKESIIVILETARGERVMRPDFGCGIHNFVFQTINVNTLGRMESSVLAALVKWEPRIEVKAVRILTDDISKGRVTINIDYLVINTNNQFNMVYPFYLTEGSG